MIGGDFMLKIYNTDIETNRIEEIKEFKKGSWISLGIIEVNYEETILMKTSKVMSIIGIILFIMYVNMEEIKNILIDKSKEKD